MSFWCAADNDRHRTIVGSHPLDSARLAVAPYEMVSSNSARNSVFDLSVAHLHRLIALHIITKFLP
jgi:hypothetical protein